MASRYRALVTVRHAGGVTQAGDVTELAARDATWLLAAGKVEPARREPNAKPASSPKDRKPAKAAKTSAAVKEESDA